MNVNTFGQIVHLAVDGHVCAEPLYVPNLVIPGQGALNVVFVATEHDTIYAFNADTNTGPNGGLIWQTNLGTSAATPDPNFGSRYGAYHDVNPEVGITSTPVIDTNSGTMYVDVFTHTGSAYLHHIHALNITNGTEQSYSPVEVLGSVPGTGVEWKRKRGAICVGTAFATAGAGSGEREVVCLLFEGYADTDPYHGWVFEFKRIEFAVGLEWDFQHDTECDDGGVWRERRGGRPLDGRQRAVSSTSNNIYFQSGNGSFSANTNGRRLQRTAS